jgi:hypothetical protein
LGLGIEIEEHRFLRRLSVAMRGLGKGAPGSELFRCGFLRHKKEAVLYP